MRAVPLRIWLLAAGFVLVGCGQSNDTVPAAAPGSEVPAQVSESPAPTLDGPNLTKTKVSCQSGEGAAGQVAEPAPPGKSRGKATPEEALNSVEGVTAARYKAVNVDASTIEFVRDDNRYVIKVTRLPEGTWFEEARQYCMKSGADPVVSAPTP